MRLSSMNYEEDSLDNERMMAKIFELVTKY